MQFYINDDGVYEVNIFLSQTIKNFTEEEIQEAKNQIEIIIQQESEPYPNIKFNLTNVMPIIENFGDEVRDVPVFFLASAIEELSKADFALFPKDYETMRGSVIEKEICDQYNIPTIMMEENDDDIPTDSEP